MRLDAIRAMTAPSQRPTTSRVWDDPRIRFPDEATWAAMSPEAREETLERIEAVLDEHREAMEGNRKLYATPNVDPLQRCSVMSRRIRSLESRSRSRA